MRTKDKAQSKYVKFDRQTSIAFVLPYFGKFKSYFPLFLRSVKNNPSIDWFIFTDCAEEYDWPQNVHLIVESFDDFSDRIRRLFPFEISLESPYKLCDYKPSYGEALQEFLSKYDFWGFCDCDLIFGNIRSFITEDILKKYNKVFTRGHMTLFRNTSEVNAFYRTQTMVPYIDVYSSNHSFSFDEWPGISNIWDSMGLEYYDELVMDDICVGLDNLRPTKIISETGETVLKL